MKVAFVYDWVHTMGGAERILISLHSLFPNAPLFTSVYNTEGAKWARSFTIKTSFLQNIPFSKTHHQWFPLFTPIAFEQFDFSNYDCVISITSADAKGIITGPKTFHICYLLTPTRYIWSHYDSYISNPLLKKIANPFVSYLKVWDRIAGTRPDHIISISKTVQNRVKKYYAISSEVIYPPVDIGIKTKKKELLKEDYFLVVSRLVPYKRIDLIIKACNRLNKRLVIVGDGRSFLYLKSIAGKTIEFKKTVGDEMLSLYYQSARALIIASEEDFGIAPLEAQAHGVPVIAYKKGGVLETVVDKKTGILFKNQSIEDISRAIETFENRSFSKKDCIDNALRFSEKRFKKEFLKALDFQYRRFFRIIH